MPEMFTYRDLEAWKRAMALVEGRRTTKAYANHVSIALGSHGELETCLELSARLGFLTREQKDAQPQPLASSLYGTAHVKLAASLTSPLPV
jgi:hypothetical protein